MKIIKKKSNVRCFSLHNNFNRISNNIDKFSPVYSMCTYRIIYPVKPELKYGKPIFNFVFRNGCTKLY